MSRIIYGGDVYSIALDEERDAITPKNGRDNRRKYCVVIGTPDYGYYVAYLIVNHEINMNFNTTREAIDGFFPITHADYPEFILPKYDPSWVDTNRVREMSAERMLNEGTFVCRLTDKDLSLILQTLANSTVLTPKEKRRYGVLPPK